MSTEYSLWSSLEYSLFPQSNSLCPQRTVYVLRVQFMSQEYSLCPQSTVYVPKNTVYVSLE